MCPSIEIDRVIYPVRSLGPGERLVLWVIGCNRRCFRCANPELWDADPGRAIAVQDLVALVGNAFAKHRVDGITITGGDPFEQLAGLAELMGQLRMLTEDILIYTGYTLKELEARSEPEISIILTAAAVLVDGSYVDELNDNACALRGSTNQAIHIYNDRLRQMYHEYAARGRTMQNMLYRDRLISIGIHNRGKKV